MTKRIVAIVNPISGRRDVITEVEHIGSLIEEAGGCFEIQITKRTGHATQITSALNSDTHALLVAGGDGTVSEVVNGFQDRCIPIVILQSGTSNLLARELEEALGVKDNTSLKPLLDTLTQQLSLAMGAIEALKLEEKVHP